MGKFKTLLTVFFAAAALWMFVTAAAIVTGHTVRPSPAPYSDGLAAACVGLVMLYGCIQLRRVRAGARARLRPEPRPRGVKAFHALAVASVSFLLLKGLLSGAPLLILGSLVLALPVGGELLWRLLRRRSF